MDGGYRFALDIVSGPGDNFSAAGSWSVYFLVENENFSGRRNKMPKIYPFNKYEGEVRRLNKAKKMRRKIASPEVSR